MSLEQNQELHNAFISNSHNVSGSNDPQQIPNDITEQLIKGAQVAARGQELGYTVEETIDQILKRVDIGG